MPRAQKKLSITAARGLLKALDAALAKGGSNAAALWDILSALRGPDLHSPGAKKGTIAVRRAALPMTAASAGRYDLSAYFGNSGVGDVGSLARGLDAACGFESRHFEGHLLRARSALTTLFPKRTIA